MQHAIEFQDVYRRFGDDEVLRGLSFTVEEGQIYAFLGRNGTGKTTALRILMGLLAPHHGATRVLGTPSLAFGSKERGTIGYVTEGHRLYHELSVKQTLAFEAGTRPGFQRKFADDALGRLGIRLGQRVGSLSRGQRAQLSLVITVAGNPKVLVLDDPALGLDVVLRREFLDAMIDFLSGRGTTVLFSSHILTDVERIADRIGILLDGRLCVDAPLEELQRRVEVRTWRGTNGATLPQLGCVLRATQDPRGTQLCLLDASERDVASLRDHGAHLSDPVRPSLEDLFVQLTANDRTTGLLSPLSEEV